MQRILIAIGVLALASCASPLPTHEPFVGPPGAPELCGGRSLLDATLQGSPTDPHRAWIESKSGGRIEVVWPADYSARFTPQLEVLDANGHIVMREGDRVEGGCVTQDPGVLYLIPPFK